MRFITLTQAVSKLPVMLEARQLGPMLERPGDDESPQIHAYTRVFMVASPDQPIEFVDVTETIKEIKDKLLNQPFVLSD